VLVIASLLVTLPPTGQLIFLLAAGLIAGAVNAVAGGGSLLVFPALLAIGLPPLPANVTNSVAQWPGYVGTVFGVQRELKGQRARVISTIGVAVFGAGLGCAMLLVLPGSVFNAVVPILVILASLALAASPWLRRWIGTPEADATDRLGWLLPAVFFASVYGGYFGGALGVILVGVLGLALHRLKLANALKSLLSALTATVTVIVFGLFGPVHWLLVAVAAPASLLGGFAGARVATRIPSTPLRVMIVVFGVAVSIYLFLRG
jgi:uncharacterized membrane protein YfcA